MAPSMSGDLVEKAQLELGNFQELGLQRHAQHPAFLSHGL